MEGARTLWEHFQTAVQSVGQPQQADAVTTETLKGDCFGSKGDLVGSYLATFF